MSKSTSCPRRAGRLGQDVLGVSIFTLLLLALAFAAGVPAAGSPAAGPPAAGPPADDELQPDHPIDFSDDGPWVVRVHFPDRATVASLVNRIDVWKVDHRTKILTAQVDEVDVLQLRSEGLELEIDQAKTRKLRRLGIPLTKQAGGIPGYPCYRTVEETFASAEAIVTAHPDLATWIDVGDSWEKVQNPSAGYDMKVLVLTQSAIPGPKPRFFASCAIHAREYATAELCTRFAEQLVDGYGVDADATWILDHHEVHLMLHTNPDGRKMAETGLSWRKNTDNDYCSNTNSRGADLNRNFDFQWGCCSGSSGFECDATYRGPAPASEPEILALEAYVRAIFPDQRAPELTAPAPADATGVAIDIHSYGELVLWSWGFTSDVPPNGTALQTLGRKLAFWNGHEPDQGIGLYPTDGTSKDFYYGDLGIAGLVFELGTEFFESCAFFESSILPGNLPALTYAAKVVRTPYLTPAGPETVAVVLPARPFAPGDPVPVAAALDDTRYNNMNGTEPSQAVAAAEAFLDVPPWAAGAVALAMTASDGAFDEMIEDAEVTLDTTGLAPGRHIVFVRGTDAAGNVGAVSAAFLDLLDPASAPVIEGTVRDADALAPLAAVVTIGPYTTDTDPGTGFYQLQVPAGTYDLVAEAPAYLPGTAVDVVANDLDVVERDFNLVPESACVAVDFDDGSAAGWLNSGASTCSTGTFVVATPTEVVYGGVTTQVGGDHTSGSGNAFFSAVNTSAGSNDVDGGTCIVESPVYPMVADSDVSIWYFHGQRDQGDDSGDFFLLEMSIDGGANWSPLASYGDVTVDAVWTEVTTSVDAGSSVQFRVQVADGPSAGDLVEGGIDDLWICPAAPACSVDGDCDDGLFCNGAETCSAGTCQPGTPITCPDDGIGCTADACDEATDACVSTPDDGLCQNGLFVEPWRQVGLQLRYRF